MAKLNEIQAVEIRNKLAKGVSGAAIAREYRVSVMAISRIKNGKAWLDITGNKND